MKIGPLDSSKPIAPASSDARSSGAARAGGDAQAAPAPAEASAKVELSSAGAMLAGAAASGDFDAAKVERIAQAIRDGRFEVNAEAIADKLIAHTRELLQPPSH